MNISGVQNSFHAYKAVMEQPSVTQQVAKAASKMDNDGDYDNGRIDNDPNKGKNVDIRA